MNTTYQIEGFDEYGTVVISYESFTLKGAALTMKEVQESAQHRGDIRRIEIREDISGAVVTEWMYAR